VSISEKELLLTVLLAASILFGGAEVAKAQLLASLQPQLHPRSTYSSYSRSTGYYGGGHHTASTGGA